MLRAIGLLGLGLILFHVSDPVKPFIIAAAAFAIMIPRR